MQIFSFVYLKNQGKSEEISEKIRVKIIKSSLFISVAGHWIIDNGIDNNLASKYGSAIYQMFGLEPFNQCIALFCDL